MWEKAAVGFNVVSICPLPRIRNEACIPYANLAKIPSMTISTTKLEEGLVFSPQVPQEDRSFYITRPPSINHTAWSVALLETDAHSSTF